MGKENVGWRIALGAVKQIQIKACQRYHLNEAQISAILYSAIESTDKEIN